MCNVLARAAPKHVLTIPDFTQAVITVSGESQGDNRCPAGQVTVNCQSTDHAISFDITVPDPVLFSFIVSDLLQDTVYTCRVKFASSGFSEDITFRTSKYEYSKEKNIKNSK